ncbi:PepSY domain-containing protein [Spongiibacter tropicus]|uniref:PepSY domain-containing protein n=1 Tax=Spongiibacter tropicus TaxID=454602 RepID=UPI003A9A5A49
MKLKRWLYLLHRWTGVALCLLFAMWFFSGVVMMYVGFPSLTQAERLAALPPLDADTITAGPRALLDRSSPEALQQLKLSSVAGRPAYLLQNRGGQWQGMFADNGEHIRNITLGQALAAAEVYVRQRELHTPPTAEARLIDMDQWSVSGSLHAHRPLYHIALHDDAGTELYISSVTGEVLRDTHRHERVWNWLGANLHWIYPVALRRHPSVWHWLIVGLSLAGLVSIFTGAVVGILRLRLRKRYRGKDISPYRNTMKLHHLLGLAVLLPLCTYMFSGLMSMNPWGLFSDETSYRQQADHYRGIPSQTQFDDAEAIRKALRHHPDARELHWQWFNGEVYTYTINDQQQRDVIDPAAGGNWAAASQARLQHMMLGYSLIAAERLDRYDHYYYSHHERWRPLPVLRLRFDDPAQSWFHIDLHTGELLGRMTTKRRAQRWLYNGLHSLDFLFLIQHRPRWDLLVISLSIAGFLFSLTACLIGWRRLRPPPRRNRQRQTRRHEARP